MTELLTAQTLATLVCVATWASIANAVASLCHQSRRWRVGRERPTRWLPGLISFPKRYLVDVHAVVARHRPTSWMHAMLASGFLVSLAGWALFPWLPVALSLFTQTLASGLCGGGLMLLIGRRRRKARQDRQRPQRLSGGAFVWLPLAFALYWAGSAVLTAALSGIATESPGHAAIAAAIAIVLALGYLVGFAMRHPGRHALLGALYISAHPNPARFEQGSQRRLADAEASTNTLASVGAARDFHWKQLLSFDACIECGRCQAVCPAYATGHPLNPKALIQDLVRSAGLREAPYRGDGHMAGTTSLPPSVMGIAQETLWSCTTCAACVEACPMFIEHVDAVTDMRRHLTQSLGAVPGKLPRILREIRESGNSFGFPAVHRWSWATDLNLRAMSEVSSADVLVWAGDAGFELHGQQTLRALLQMLDIAGVDHAMLDTEELDCGHLSRRCGDESAFAQLREANLRVLAKYSFRTLLTADPHAFHTLRDEYPPGPWEVVHHTEYLERLLANGRLVPRATAPRRSTVFHDACYLGRYGQVFDAPRTLLSRAGRETIEAPRSRDMSFCCGGGGGHPWAGQVAPKSISIVRLEELTSTGADEIAVACPNCKNMLQSAAGQRARVRDVAEILREAL